MFNHYHNKDIFHMMMFDYIFAYLFHAKCLCQLPLIRLKQKLRYFERAISSFPVGSRWISPSEICLLYLHPKTNVIVYMRQICWGKIEVDSLWHVQFNYRQLEINYMASHSAHVVVLHAVVSISRPWPIRKPQYNSNLWSPLRTLMYVNCVWPTTVVDWGTISVPTSDRVLYLSPFITSPSSPTQN